MLHFHSRVEQESRQKDTKTKESRKSRLSKDGMSSTSGHLKKVLPASVDVVAEDAVDFVQELVGVLIDVQLGVAVFTDHALLAPPLDSLVLIFGGQSLFVQLLLTLDAVGRLWFGPPGSDSLLPFRGCLLNKVGAVFAQEPGLKGYGVRQLDLLAASGTLETILVVNLMVQDSSKRFHPLFFQRNRTVTSVAQGIRTSCRGHFA